jgi:acetyl-CoA carboxylase biotin carboxyl carrier protein
MSGNDVKVVAESISQFAAGYWNTTFTDLPCAAKSHNVKRQPGTRSIALQPQKPKITHTGRHKFMELTEDDVLQILKLIDESKFDYFQLEVGELKITVSKGEPIPLKPSNPGAPAAQAATPPSPQRAPAPATTPHTKTEPQKPAPKPAAVPEGLVPVTAPLLGTFYVAPEPGAPPFVEVGASVTEDTTVGLIEVMKVFNSVRANVNGVITELVAQNGQFVEYGQTLFLVKPA